MLRYRAVVAGDTGYDNGIFNCGDYASVEEAVSAMNNMVAQCYHELYYGMVIDNHTGEVVVRYNPNGN